jgi:hypothetical protein
VNFVSERKLYGDPPYKEKDINLYVRLDNKADKVVGVKWTVLAFFIIVTILTVIPYPLIKNITDWIVFGFVSLISLMSLIHPGIIIVALILGTHYFLSWYIHKIAFNIVVDQVSTKEENEANHLKLANEKIIFKSLRITSNKTKSDRKTTKSKSQIFKNVLKFTFSPDFYFANQYKNSLRALLTIHPCDNTTDCKHNDGICYHQWDTIKIAKKYFIQFSNWINIITVSLLGVIILILHENTVTYFDSLLLGVIVLRIISRFIEISIAFYKDNVLVHDKIFKSNDGTDPIYIHRWKNSLLLKSSRISLAVHSLIEVIILFSLFYYLASNIGIIEIPFSKPVLTMDEESGAITLLESNYITQFKDYLLYTISVTAMNFSFDPTYVVSWLGLAHIAQVILSLVLIVLSIASYIGLDNNLTKREEDFYLSTQPKKVELEEKLKELNAKKFKKNTTNTPSEITPTDSST